MKRLVSRRGFKWVQLAWSAEHRLGMNRQFPANLAEAVLGGPFFSTRHGATRGRPWFEAASQLSTPDRNRNPHLPSQCGRNVVRAGK